MACSLALLGHRSTDSTRDRSTPPMIPATLVMAGNSNSAQNYRFWEADDAGANHMHLCRVCLFAMFARVIAEHVTNIYLLAGADALLHHAIHCSWNQTPWWQLPILLKLQSPVGDSVVPKTTDRKVRAVMLASDSDSSTTTLRKPTAAEQKERHSDSRKPSLLMW